MTARLTKSVFTPLPGSLCSIAIKQSPYDSRSRKPDGLKSICKVIRGVAILLTAIAPCTFVWAGETTHSNQNTHTYLLSVNTSDSSNQASVTKAQEEEAEETDEAGVLANVGSLVDETHSRYSDRFSSFIVQIDDYLGKGDSGKPLNTSWARVRLDTVKPGAEDARLAAKVKLRIVLPQAQQRFRLLVSTEDGGDAGSSNSDAAQREKIAADENNEVALALRFIRTAREEFSVNYDLGARYKDDKAQVFARLNVGYIRPWILGFENKFTNNLTYFSASGYENRFRIDSLRRFFGGDSLYFRNSAEISWRKGYKGAGFGETIGLYADLGKRRALALEGITGYATALNDGATENYLGSEVRLRFRHSVWRPWFYYEIWPSVSWSSSNDYKKAYGGLIRLEVTFGRT